MTVEQVSEFKRTTQVVYRALPKHIKAEFPEDTVLKIELCDETKLRIITVDGSQVFELKEE